MRRAMAISVLVLAFGLVSGCTPMSQRQLRAPEVFDLQKNGIAFMSLGRKGQSVMQAFHVHFRLVGSTDEMQFYAIPENMVHDKKGVIKEGDVVVEVVGHQLKPGDYEIFKYGAFFDTGMFSGSTWSKRPFSYRFRVVAGEAVYLGRFLFLQEYGKNVFGLKVSGGGTYVITDERAADTSRMRELRNDAKNARVVSRLPSSADTDSPFMLISK